MVPGKTILPAIEGARRPGITAKVMQQKLPIARLDQALADAFAVGLMGMMTAMPNSSGSSRRLRRRHRKAPRVCCVIMAHETPETRKTISMRQRLRKTSGMFKASVA